METEKVRPGLKEIEGVKFGRGTATVVLDYPVQWGEEEIEKVVIKRPKGKHIKSLGEGTRVNDLLKIASKCSGISMGVFDEMDGSDAFKVAEAVGELL